MFKLGKENSQIDSQQFVRFLMPDCGSRRSYARFSKSVHQHLAIGHHPFQYDVAQFDYVEARMF